MIRLKEKVYTDGYAIIDSKSDYRLSHVLRIVDRIIPKQPKCILDIGCGDGKFSAELGLTLRGEEIFGIDISFAAVEKAIARNIKAKALDVDEEDLPFKDNMFDFIFCGSLIELVLDPDHLLEEIYRVLAPGGYSIITFPNLCNWASRIAVLLGFHPYYDRVSKKYNVGKLFISPAEVNSTGFIHLYTVRSFKQLAELYGLKVVKFWGARGTFLPRTARFIDELFCKFPSFAFQVICLLAKE